MARTAGLLRRLKRFLFPEKFTCVCCGEELYEDSYVCPRCRACLPVNGGYLCSKCGRAMREQAPVCLECKAAMPSYHKARSAFRYEGEIVRLVKRFKTGARYLAAFFADSMLPLLAEAFADTDFLLPVPMTARARRRRGYNQSQLLAEALSARAGIPAEAGVLVKTRDTAAQKELSRRERAENLRGSFRVHERTKCRGKNILIVDDVMTTGATADAAALALLRAGARKVCLLTAASVPDARPRGESEG